MIHENSEVDPWNIKRYCTVKLPKRGHFGTKCLSLDERLSSLGCLYEISRGIWLWESDFSVSFQREVNKTYTQCRVSKRYFLINYMGVDAYALCEEQIG